jgi:hypothetical protein
VSTNRMQIAVRHWPAWTFKLAVVAQALTLTTVAIAQQNNVEPKELRSQHIFMLSETANLALSIMTWLAAGAVQHRGSRMCGSADDLFSKSHG